MTYKLLKTVPEIDFDDHKATQTATFCLGCFWGPDAEFGAMEGIIRTRVGYSGGTLDNPSYHNIGDHIETIQIDFDPEIISFNEICEVFWSGHNPFEPYWKRQYAKAVFYHNSEQKAIIKECRDKIIKSSGKPVNTGIIEFEKFYIAENYHQKYHLQNIPVLIGDYKIIFESIEDFINSTSSARVNGYVSGYGRLEDFNSNLTRLGLSDGSLETLKTLFYRYKKKVV